MSGRSYALHNVCHRLSFSSFLFGLLFNEIRCLTIKEPHRCEVCSRSNLYDLCVVGITYPNGQQQKQLLLEVYATAQLDPTRVSYVEAHGTGTKVRTYT